MRDVKSSASVSSAWPALVLVGILAVLRLILTANGHPSDWSDWTLLLAIASAAGEQVVPHARARRALRVLTVLAFVASIAGLIGAIVYEPGGSPG